MIWVTIFLSLVVVLLFVLLWRLGVNYGLTGLKTRIGKIILAAILIVFVLYLLYRLRILLYIIAVIPWLADQMVELGVNLWLARSIAIALFVPIIYVIKLLASKDPLRKRKGFIAACIIGILYCLGMFFAQRDYAFDKITGEARVCYAATPYGYEDVPCTWKFHPIWNTKVEPADPVKIRAEIFKRKGYPKIERLTPTPEMQFFDPITGESLVWYYQSPDGTIELFGHPGYHPQYGVVLAPVNPEIVQEVLKRIRENKVDLKSKIIIHETPASTQEASPPQGKKFPTFDGLQKLSNDLENLIPKK